MQIAIDGPAGAGKSTIAKLVAKKLGITYLDTGAMYRAVTLAVKKQGGDFNDQEEMIQIAKESEIALLDQRVFLNGEDVTDAIRTPEISKHTSDVAPVAEIRDILVEEQRRIAKGTSVIMDGRDIGTVVLPEADYKFYLDADAAVRAERRYKELLEKGTDQTLEDIKRDIIQRDYNDMHRQSSPLVKADDAVVIDSTSMKIDEVVETIISYIHSSK